MCDLCGDARHQTSVSRRHFLKTGALAALAPWAMGTAFAGDPPARVSRRHRTRLRPRTH